jgi:DNA-binding transcriptional ArsR family regulator
MRDIPHPVREQSSLPDVLNALSDPIRLEIVRTLRDGAELSCGRLGVPVSKSTLSHHLKVLRDAGLTHTRAEGVQRFVSLRTGDIEALYPGLLGCVLEHAQRQLQTTADRGA